MLKKDQFKELWEEDLLEEVQDNIDDSWRHGNNHNTVFKYVKDTGEVEYYLASYQVSGDGEFHGIRDDEFYITLVEPHKKVVEIIEYLPVK